MEIVKRILKGLAARQMTTDWAIPFCSCLRCGYQCVRRIAARPRRCARCRSPYWDKRRGELKLGRGPGRNRLHQGLSKWLARTSLIPHGSNRDKTPLHF
jgi:hypothetical protein